MHVRGACHRLLSHRTFSFHSDNEEPIMRGTCAAVKSATTAVPGGGIELPVAEIEQRIFEENVQLMRLF